MPEKFDFKKQYQDLYLPKAAPQYIDVPALPMIQVDGSGAPQGEDYQQAMQVLYALSFTIKMSKMGDQTPPGYFDYVVPPLEGLWWCPGGALDFAQPKQTWLWTSMIRQPDFVTPAVFDWAVEQCRRKKPGLPLSRARYTVWAEGPCVQALHTGAYDDEAPTLARLHAFAKAKGLALETGEVRKHHEIYLSDPRRTAPARLRTVLRLPVATR